MMAIFRTPVVGSGQFVTLMINASNWKSKQSQSQSQFVALEIIASY